MRHSAPRTQTQAQHIQRHHSTQKGHRTGELGVLEEQVEDLGVGLEQATQQAEARHLNEGAVEGEGGGGEQ